MLNYLFCYFFHGCLLVPLTINNSDGKYITKYSFLYTKLESTTPSSVIYIDTNDILQRFSEILLKTMQTNLGQQFRYMLLAHLNASIQSITCVIFIIYYKGAMFPPPRTPRLSVFCLLVIVPPVGAVEIRFIVLQATCIQLINRNAQVKGQLELTFPNQVKPTLQDDLVKDQ